MNYTKFSNTYIYPMVRFSSSKPDFNNDWSNWSGGQEVLFYDDVVFVALGMDDFSNHNIEISFLSDSLKFNSNESISNIDSLLEDKICLHQGKLFLKEKILDVGEDFDEFEIFCGKTDINIEIFGTKDATQRFELVCILEK